MSNDIQMFNYRDKELGKVKVIYNECDCTYRRPHPFTIRPKRCCFCCKLCKIGLLLLALAILLFGLITWLTIFILVLGLKLSAIYLYSEFQTHTFAATSEIILCFFVGILLIIAYVKRKRKLAQTAAWVILFGYVVAIVYILAIFTEGISVVHALVYYYYGKEYENDKMETVTNNFVLCFAIYVAFLSLHIILLVFLTTYAAMLIMAYYDLMLKKYKITEDNMKSKPTKKGKIDKKQKTPTV